MFVDEAQIVAVAGDGGNGCVAFRREKYVARGGPSGGNGGRGGSVHIVADESHSTLQHLAGKHHWRAGRGGNGEGGNRHGRNGKDVSVLVPPGTVVRDAVTKVTLKDLAEPGASVCVARGGRGGRGNAFFKGPTNQAPRHAEPGEPGEQRTCELELKLVADAGLVGKPNAGKSTLLSRLSAALPKIAAYPFTTRTPHLGIVELPDFRRFVLADIPGLIAGAHSGAGLGDEFLRHVERTRLLVHVVDVCPPHGDPADDYRMIRDELAGYSPVLAQRRELVVANKMDLTGSDAALRRLGDAVGGQVVPVSAVTGRGLEALTERIWAELETA
ncbi:MAG: GTPase ObgE [Planctomycetota bacterium]